MLKLGIDIEPVTCLKFETKQTNKHKNKTQELQVRKRFKICNNRIEKQIEFSERARESWILQLSLGL